VNDEKMWMIRAGENAYLIDEFVTKNVVAVGWIDDIDLSTINTQELLKKRMVDAYPDTNIHTVNNWTSQISKFLFEFVQDKDYAVTYNSNSRCYHIGKINSGYEYNNNIIPEYPHIRHVAWIGTVSRDMLSSSARNTLGAISTIFCVNDNVKAEILEILSGKKPAMAEEGETEEIIKEDMQLKSLEFIKDKVAALNWIEMQDLIAGILRAMGYRTLVSQKGPDRGKDIIASPDGLGLEEPNIRTEVKHRKGQMGAQDIRSFVGGLRVGMKGLYVSTGGFTKEARYEAERSTIHISLIDLDMLVGLVIQYYDQFDIETRALLPLTKIYWPE
jgi:restriction system protein